MRTYDHDCNLPYLPVPPLEETAAGLKQRIRPIVSHEEYSAFCQELERFCATDGEGPILQEHLRSWQDSLPGNSSWLRPFWDDNYISYRQSIPRNTHYTLQLRHDKWSPGALPRFTAAMAACIQNARHETIPPERSGKDYTSMDSMGGMIYTRIPAPVRDLWYYPRLTDPLTAAVVCRGHWFILSLTDSKGIVRAPDLLQDAYQEIRRQAEQLPAAPFVGAFTCADRETAVEVRSALSHYMLNRLSLESIEKAAFAVCLDDEAPGEASFGQSVLAGDAGNRWFDKVFELISSGERLGASLEHSGCDGIMWAYLFGQADEAIATNGFQYSGETAPAHIRPLGWVVPAVLAETLRQIRLDFAVWNQSMRFDQKRISSLAKSTIKQLKCSPDAVVQLLFQTAYHRLAGKLRSVYEAVSTRSFYGGRTECVRSCTAQSQAFIDAFHSGQPKDVIAAQFRLAVDAHSENTARCKAGLGCERHVSGLLCMHEMYFPDRPLPAVFQTAGYQILKHDALSTSSIPGSAIDYFAFVPVVQDGLGLGYALYDSGLHVAISSYPESGIHPSDLIRTLEEVGAELMETLL